MDRIWFPLLATMIIAEIALAITQYEETRRWHEEEMVQWRREDNPGKEKENE